MHSLLWYLTCIRYSVWTWVDHIRSAVCRMSSRSFRFSSRSASERLTTRRVSFSDNPNLYLVIFFIQVNPGSIHIHRPQIYQPYRLIQWIIWFEILFVHMIRLQFLVVWFLWIVHDATKVLYRDNDFLNYCCLSRKRPHCMQSKQKHSSLLIRSWRPDTKSPLTAAATPGENAVSFTI